MWLVDFCRSDEGGIGESTDMAAVTAAAAMIMAARQTSDCLVACHRGIIAPCLTPSLTLQLTRQTPEIFTPKPLALLLSSATTAGFFQCEIVVGIGISLALAGSSMLSIFHQ